MQKKSAPGILKGIGSTEVEDILSRADESHIKALTADNFAVWAALSGVRVDGHVFDFNKHRYLLPIYLDSGKEIAWMKAAQLGATIYLLLRLLWFARYHTVKCGLYFPTGEGVENLSKDRLGPLIKSNDELQNNLSDTNTLGLKQMRNIYEQISSLYMLYVGGRASKDSVPLDIVAFDEVRLIDPHDIDQCLERISHSEFKYKIYMSTAGLPETDIHSRFLRGSQLTWHVNCESPSTCPDGFVPADTWPDCIAEKSGETYLRCPKCKKRIRDPQYGRYIAHNPGADFNSYSVSQLISKFITPKEIWDSYHTTTHIEEFYNAKLGRPYVDEQSRPITEETLEKSTNPDLKWGYQTPHEKRRKWHTAMGIDQGKGTCHVVIVKKNRYNKKQVVHVELIESDNPHYYKPNEYGQPEPVTPFIRCKELMKEFNVDVCVVDGGPNHNEAWKMCREFKGKVFAAYYADTSKEIALWKDRMRDPASVKKGSTEIKNKYEVTVGRYPSMDYFLRSWADGQWEMPHPLAQRQIARSERTGRFEAVALGERFQRHLRGLVRRVKVTDEETGTGVRYQWVYLGRDPHFAHAGNYANIALERMRPRGGFTLL